jgi:RNA polymerase-binding transcription factor DksA
MYHPKETEKLLTTRLRLLEARQEEIQKLLREPEDDDLVEQAGELGDDDTLERLAQVTKGEILHIRRALRRLADGTYGRCESCGIEIDSRRLQALSSATTCIDCARASASPYRSGPFAPHDKEAGPPRGASS